MPENRWDGLVDIDLIWSVVSNFLVNCPGLSRCLECFECRFDLEWLLISIEVAHLIPRFTPAWIITWHITERLTFPLERPNSLVMSAIVDIA